MRVAGAQEPECTLMYMRITRRTRGSPFGPFATRMFASASCLRSPSTAGAQIVERSRFFEVPHVRLLGRQERMIASNRSACSAGSRIARASGRVSSRARPRLRRRRADSRRVRARAFR
ncbi:MAG: hypothetical protein E6K53_01510 [Gammaproteobacteria bacterium]|nr:MAG: hypothetical protein E6K53_01510 [Gammaproteobacteria bacterium]